MKTIELIMSLSVSVLFLSGCNSCNTEKPNPSNTTTQIPKTDTTPPRNCYQEYNEFVAQGFNTAQEARMAIGNYLVVFSSETQCNECVEKMRQIEAEFVEMDNLFSVVENDASKNRYCTFAQMVKSDGGKFSNSRFETVRKTWETMRESKNVAYMAERLDLINEDDFKNKMLKYAEDLAAEWYREGKGIIGKSEKKGKVAHKRGWHVIGSSIKGNMEIVQVEGKPAKRCKCTVNVEMQGNGSHKPSGNVVGKILKREGSTDILVEGILEINPSDCSMSFEELSHQQTEVYGDLVKAYNQNPNADKKRRR